jgi:glycosyltransferase involved in cell wall biosynthesis
MSELPLVTAIIPVHNHENWVANAVESIRTQTYEKKRLIVVDDGSTDESLKNVLSLMTIRGEEQSPDGLRTWYGQYGELETLVASLPKAYGPAFARNAGAKIGLEGTDIYAFLDSDDTYEQEKVSMSVAAFMTAPNNIGVVYSDFSTFNPETGISVRQYKEPYSRKRLVSECIINCDSLVSKSAFVHCGGFDNELRVCEDYDLWLRLTENFVAVHIAEDLVRIRVGSHSSTANVPSETWNKNMARVMQKTRERAVKNA